MKFIEKAPIWLRWILFFPLAFLSSISVYLAAALAIKLEILTSDRLELAILIILTHLLVGFIYVIVGAAVAPRANLLISIFLVLFIASIVGLFLLMAIFFPDPYTNKIAFEGGIVVLGSLIGLIKIWKKYKNVQKSGDIPSKQEK